jgi:hypothetical protein
MFNKLKGAQTKVKRYIGEESWFSGLFDKSKFKPDKTSKTTSFQKIQTMVRDTNKIDTYDLIFNLQMPSLAESPFFSQTKDDKLVDYYCNNKIHIRLYFKDERLFDNLTGTECILSPPVFKSKQTSNFQSSGIDIKSSGIYLSSYNDINVTIKNAVDQAIIDGAVTNAQRKGPFSDSKKGVTKENLNEKLEQSNYRSALIDYVDDILSPGKTTSPFKVYDAQYTQPVTPETGGIISNTNFSNIEDKKRFFDSNYQYFMQFDFDLNEYTTEKDSNDKITKIVKKIRDDPGSSALSDTSESLLMLLKKNEWISIVFQGINIPFDIRTIPADMVKIELQIENDYPEGYIGPLNIFYKNFFCQFLDMTLKKYIETPIVVHDIMFQREDMLRALKLKSTKYFSKIAQLNNLARKVLYYYLKNIDETQGGEYSGVYKDMTTNIENAKTQTDAIVNGKSANISKGITELKATVKKANNEIRKFSNFFKRDNIKIFRKKFFQALLRGHAKTGLSGVTEANITEALKKIDNLEESLKPGITNIGPTKENSPLLLTEGTNDKPPVASDMSQDVSADALNMKKGGSDYYQEGGAQGGAIFQSDDYNLMIPMDIRKPGTGINDMTVRIHKIHLDHVDSISTQEIDDETSVDLQVGDAIRFVYNDDIVYAIICGFKPGKPLNDDGTDKAMDINDFRKTYIDISKTFESQDLKLTPEQFLSLTNLRGIKYLPFQYVDNTYSFVSYDDERAVSESLNSNIKRGLNGMFNFSCKDPVIPILPNGYVLPFTSRVKEGVSTFFDKFNPSSTKADIGKDNMLPQYSLPSYMTLEKVFVPPNFAEIVASLKNFTGDNPDEIFDMLKKTMEDKGLNESTGCKKTSVNKMASDFSERQKTFMSDAKRITNQFNTRFVKNGKIINTKGAMEFIKNYYMKPIESGVFVDKDGLPLRTVTQLVYCLNLIPNDPIRSMSILIRALSQDGVPTLLQRQKVLSEVIVDSDSDVLTAKNSDDYISGGTIQSGGAEDILKADKIIKGTIGAIASQKFFDEKTKKMLTDNLDSAEAVYDPTETDDTPVTSSAMVKSGKGTGFGRGPGSGSGSGSGSGFGSSLLANIFKGSNMNSASGKGTAIGNDSCGNNTSIVCNGEDLVVTVTLKLNELIASCMDPEMIQHLGNHPGNFLTNNDHAVQGEAPEEVDSTAAASAEPAAPAAPSIASKLIGFSAAAAAPPSDAAAVPPSDAPTVPPAPPAAPPSAAPSESPAPPAAVASSDAPAAAPSESPAPPAAAASSDAPAAAPSESPAPIRPAAPAAPAPAPPVESSTTVDSLLAGVTDVLNEVSNLEKTYKEKEESMVGFVQGISSKIYSKDNLAKILVDLQKINSKPGEEKKKSIDFYNFIKTIYEANINEQMPILFKRIKEYADEYLKAAPANFDSRVKIFQQNLSKLGALEKNGKLSAEDTKKIDSIIQSSFNGKKMEEVAEILSKFIKSENSDSDIQKSIITFVIIDLISRTKNDLGEQNKTSPIENFDKLISIINATPDSETILTGGETYNKNKSKKNKKSNKNKTKKRKNSTSKKIKFNKLKIL